MYELQYTQQIVDAINHELPKYPNKKIKSVSVLLGEKYQLDPLQVQAHYQDIIAGTALDEVALYLSEELMEVLCNACGIRGPIRERDIVKCSACHSSNVKRIAGEVVNIQSVDFHPL
jgi:Zn finger protein HypA/HybF involved in hydrogenase expression